MTPYLPILIDNAALDDKIVRFNCITVYRCQSFVKSFAEEVFACQSFNLIVNPLKQLCIAILNRGSDGIYIYIIKPKGFLSLNTPIMIFPLDLISSRVLAAPVLLSFIPLYCIYD